jgi:hypothetical protein
MCMKTQGETTQCHSQLCGFEGVFETGLPCFPPHNYLALSSTHTFGAEGILECGGSTPP